MKRSVPRWATALTILAGLGLGAGRSQADFIGITYSDVSAGAAVNLTSPSNYDWVKWSNGETSGLTYTTPEMSGGSIIQPGLTALGPVPPSQSVLLVPFGDPTGTAPNFSWTDGTVPMAGGGPVNTSVSQTISPAQFSYPLGLGLSFQAAASSNPYLLSIYVAGFNARMRLTATLSGGTSETLVANNAALLPVTVPNAFNYLSVGRFDVNYAGDGQTLTLMLTADNQSGIPTTGVTQFGFPNAGVYAATVSQGRMVPEPSSLALAGIGLAGLGGWQFGRRFSSKTIGNVWGRRRNG